MNKASKYILFLILFFAPMIAGAEIIISEIAWMGTASSANHEWIEIQNTGSSGVNLSGWTLKSEDGTPSINLSGSIAAGAYALLERPDAAVPGTSALVVYTGALGNDGEHLVLRDGNGNVIQNLNFSSGWPAGNNAAKETMQWNGSIWITASPTPGQPNAMFDSGSSGNQGTGGQTGGQADVSNNNNDDEEEEDSYTIVNNKIRYDKESIEIKVHNDNVPVATPVKFSLWTRDLDGSNMVRGNFFWNMGDGTEFVLNKNEKFEHFYEHEGSYVVSVEYYSTYFEDIEPNATHRITVNISNPAIIISKIHPDGGIEIKNNSGREIDLSGWSLVENSGGKFVVPNRTFVLPGKSIVFNSKQTKLNPLNVMLMNPMNKFIASGEKFPSPVVATSPPSSSNQTVKQTQVKPKTEDVTLLSEDSVTLNSMYANSSSSTEQKGLSLWIILFAVTIIGVSIVVFFIYRNSSKEVKEDSIDEFELLD